MRTEQETTRIVGSWLEQGVTALPDRVLDAVLDQLPATPQRRHWWRAWRSPYMNNPVRLAIAAAAAALVVAVVGYNLLPGLGGNSGGSTLPPTAPPSPTVSPSPEPTQSGPYTIQPFGPGRFGICPGVDVDPPCAEDPRDDSIRITFEIPGEWELFEDFDLGAWIDASGPPDGAAVFFYRGNWLYGDPCRDQDEGEADIPVGTTVNDFVSALADHPLLDVTTPVDVTLAGYSGKYLDLQVPADISECGVYKPLGTHHYAQGPAERFHMWVLDVDGVRVVVETNDYPGTSPQRLAEVQSILDSVEIEIAP